MVRNLVDPASLQGPRMSSSPALAALTVLDEQGHAVPLVALWADGPCVLVFIRHFG